jgi:sucrose-6-phosphate hydrolase SacC (GH32 family)
MNMISKMLQKARDFEKKYLPYTTTEQPMFHLTGGIGWINDPNGFAPYKGEYHLFFQYNPYDTKWGPMHWGHVKTKDFLRWERLPAALAPDMDYDRNGCFSGGAVELPDGLEIIGTRSLIGGTAKGFNDHRIVMSAAVCAAGSQNPIICTDALSVNKSYPQFFEDYNSVGGKAEII